MDRSGPAADERESRLPCATLFGQFETRGVNLCSKNASNWPSGSLAGEMQGRPVDRREPTGNETSTLIFALTPIHPR